VVKPLRSLIAPTHYFSEVRSSQPISGSKAWAAGHALPLEQAITEALHQAGMSAAS
jgi:hypothetical protein